MKRNNYETCPCLLPFLRYQPYRQLTSPFALASGGFFGFLFKIDGSRFSPSDLCSYAEMTSLPDGCIFRSSLLLAKMTC